MRILASIKIIPIGTRDTSLSRYVATAVNVLKDLGIKYMITPFNTSIELEDLSKLNIIMERIIDSLSSLGVKRVAIDIQLDIRLDKEITLEYKIRTVEEKISK
ncbi:MAG: MTH1187 family thiamine-binding protein [Sulfolobales archaeon]